MLHILILGQGIQIWPFFFKLTTFSLIIHRMMTPCHLLVKQGQKILKIGTVHILILGQVIQIWHSFLKLTTSSLIIHRMMTPCHLLVKQGQPICIWKINCSRLYFPCILVDIATNYFFIFTKWDTVNPRFSPHPRISPPLE